MADSGEGYPMEHGVFGDLRVSAMARHCREVKMPLRTWSMGFGCKARFVLSLHIGWILREYMVKSCPTRTLLDETKLYSSCDRFSLQLYTQTRSTVSLMLL